jgi:hypothetical protein
MLRKYICGFVRKVRNLENRGKKHAEAGETKCLEMPWRSAGE